MQKVIGIIAEYNPFHLGHLYQINKIKKLYPDSTIIVLLSGSFTERGDISLINKWDKTKICLDYNIDLIIEFPTLYAIQSADIFAKAALKILNELAINILAFGSETNDLELFTKLANIQLNNSKYDETVQQYLKTGVNYPTAMALALQKFSNYKIQKPNDLLALSYIKEIIKNNYSIEPVSIKRENNYHETIVKSKIISANLIRKKIKENDNIEQYVPQGVSQYIYRNITIENAFQYLKYQIICSNNLSKYLTVEEGIENRLKKKIMISNSWQELIMNIKSKRYTYNRLNRMLLHILLRILKCDNHFEPYIKILGFNNNGKKHLHNIKKNISLPIFTNYKPNKNKTLDIEYKCTCIYSLLVNDPSLINKEFENKPLIK